jgi:hypothetical protein
MSPVVAALVSALAVFFLLLLVIIGGSLIYVALKFHRGVEAFKEELAELIVKMRETGEASQRELLEAVKKINGDELQRAVGQLNSNVTHMGKFVNRAEVAALAIGEMCQALMPEDETRKNNLGPEEYAPVDAETGSYVGQSKVAALDEEEQKGM